PNCRFSYTSSYRCPENSVTDSSNGGRDSANNGSKIDASADDNDVLDIDNLQVDKSDNSIADSSNGGRDSANNGGTVDASADHNGGEAVYGNGNVNDNDNNSGEIATDNATLNDNDHNGGEAVYGNGNVNDNDDNSGELATDNATLNDNDVDVYGNSGEVATGGSTLNDNDDNDLIDIDNLQVDKSDSSMQDQASGGENAANNGGSVDQNTADNGAIVANDDSDVDVDQSDHSDNASADNGGIIANDDSDVTVDQDNDVTNTTTTTTTNTTKTYTKNYTDNSQDIDTKTYTLSIDEVILSETNLKGKVSGSGISASVVPGLGFVAWEDDGEDGHKSSNSSRVVTGDIRNQNVASNSGLNVTNANTGVANIQTSQSVTVGTVNMGN
ncbi:MAG: hypothetical protein AAFW81_10570, partial [Pseudomonadota bacterium]